MNARILSGCAAAAVILGGTVGVLSTDAPRALAQARSEPLPRGTLEPWSRSRPPGVPPDRWIPINGGFGIVLVPQPPSAMQPGGAIRRSLAGYFAVRRAGRWWRLLPTDGASVQPLAASIGAAPAREPMRPQ